MEIQTNTSDLINELEAVLFNLPQVYTPMVHLFSPGLYTRQILMPAGTMITTAIHKITHPYVVTKGKVNVDIKGVIEQIQAPHFGLTTEGTRRVLYIIEDCVWTTFHALPYITGKENDWGVDEQNSLISKILDEITEWPDNPLLDIETKDYINKKKERQLCQLQLLEQVSQPLVADTVSIKG